jgi:hypothetical protein
MTLAYRVDKSDFETISDAEVSDNAFIKATKSSAFETRQNNGGRRASSEALHGGPDIFTLAVRNFMLIILFTDKRVFDARGDPLLIHTGSSVKSITSRKSNCKLFSSI